MKSIINALGIIETCKVASIGHNRTSGYILFDVRMHFTQKVRWGLDGHRNSLREDSVWIKVASCKSEIIAFTCVVLKMQIFGLVAAKTPTFKLLLLRRTMFSILKSFA